MFKEEAHFIDENHKRIDIWHSGIDILCPAGSKVLAVEDCKVVKVWEFTDPSDTPEYRKTWAVNVRNSDGTIAVYGELRKPRLKAGQKLKAGQMIGYVAQVHYNRNRPNKKTRCMLHFELYKKGTKKTIDWWPRGKKKPKDLLDPTKYLKTCTLIRK